MKNELMKLIEHYKDAAKAKGELVRKLQMKEIGRDEHAEIRGLIKEQLLYDEVIEDIKRIVML